MPNSRVATRAAEALTERVLADLNRSRDQWVEYVNREKARLTKSLEENVDDAVRRFQAEAAGKVAVNQTYTESYRQMLDAMRLASIRPNPPGRRAVCRRRPQGHASDPEHLFRPFRRVGRAEQRQTGDPIQRRQDAQLRLQGGRGQTAGPTEGEARRARQDKCSTRRGHQFAGSLTDR